MAITSLECGDVFQKATEGYDRLAEDYLGTRVSPEVLNALRGATVCMVKGWSRLTDDQFNAGAGAMDATQTHITDEEHAAATAAKADFLALLRKLFGDVDGYELLEIAPDELTLRKSPQPDSLTNDLPGTTDLWLRLVAGQRDSESSHTPYRVGIRKHRIHASSSISKITRRSEKPSITDVDIATRAVVRIAETVRELQTQIAPLQHPDEPRQDA